MRPCRCKRQILAGAQSVAHRLLFHNLPFMRRAGKLVGIETVAPFSLGSPIEYRVSFRERSQLSPNNGRHFRWVHTVNLVGRRQGQIVQFTLLLFKFPELPGLVEDAQNRLRQQFDVGSDCAV